ncbi:MAG: hypothetical protein AB2595_04985 [Candidatus Thiodiazotropha endolucinida]
MARRVSEIAIAKRSGKGVHGSWQRPRFHPPDRPIRARATDVGPRFSEVHIN